MAACVLGGTVLSRTVHGWADSRMRRTEAFAEYDGRPPAGEGTFWLIVGTDRRSGLTKTERHRLHTGGSAGERADTLMIVRFGASRTDVVGVPRDSYVHVPEFTDSGGVRHSAGHNKINTAYGRGGPRLLTRTLERATGLRFDHYAEIDLARFVSLVDALGGVRLCLGERLKDQPSGAALPKGCQVLDGGEALSYVRARHFDPEGDLGRIRRQQRFLAALGAHASKPDVLFDPSRLSSLLDATTVDAPADPAALAELALRLERAASKGGAVHTIPIADPGFDSGNVGEVVLWDTRKAKAMFEALRQGRPLP